MDNNVFPQPLKIDCSLFPLIGGYFYDELIKSIDEARLNIYSIQYQWKWNIHERHSKVQCLGAAIIRAQKRNVAVSVILNNESPKRNISKINRVSGDALAREGVQVRMLRTVSLLHTKLWIIDAKYCFIGSHNISGRSLNVNEEVSVKIDSETLAKFMLRYFNNLWESR